MNYYQPNNYMPYYGQQNFQQPIQPPVQQPMQPSIQQFKPSILQGKVIDSLDVAKATDIALDGSVSYFPLTDGTAIITKQLMQDGTSKMTVYKPVEDNKIETPKYLTQNDLDRALNGLDNKDIVNDIKALKKQIKGLADDIEELKEDK